MPNKTGSSRSLVLLSIITVSLNIIFQFACVIYLGAGSVTDAYFSAQVVPLLAATVLGGALTNNLTPMLARSETTRRTALLRAVLLEYGVIAVGLFGVLGGTAHWWMPVLFSGFASDITRLAIELARLFCGIAAVQVLCTIGMAGHYANERFKYVEAVQVLLLAASLFFATFVIDRFGIVGFAWLILIKNLALFLMTTPRLAITGHASVKDAMALLRSRMVLIASASIVFKTGPLIDRMLASHASPGVLTSLGVGQQLASSFLAITDKALARRLLVVAGKNSAASDRSDILSIYYRQLRSWLLVVGCGLVLAVPVAFVALHTPSLLAFVESRAFGHLDLVVLMVLTLIPSVAGQLSSALLYALGEVKAINRLAMVSFTLSILIKVVGFFIVGAYAIVAGVFLYQALNWVLLHFAAVRALRTSPNALEF